MTKRTPLRSRERSRIFCRYISPNICYTIIFVLGGQNSFFPLSIRTQFVQRPLSFSYPIFGGYHLCPPSPTILRFSLLFQTDNAAATSHRNRVFDIHRQIDVPAINILDLGNSKPSLKYRVLTSRNSCGRWWCLWTNIHLESSNRRWKAEEKSQLISVFLNFWRNGRWISAWAWHRADAQRSTHYAGTFPSLRRWRTRR